MTAIAAIRRWWFPADPIARIAVLRTVLYLFVIYDIRKLVNDVVPKGYAPEELYRPIFIPRLLGLPPPNPFIVHTLEVVLIAGCLVVAAGFLPRLVGWAVGLAYTWWLFIGMSYGKVDHDHLALWVALMVLPTVGAARWRDRTPTEAAGWALRCIQIAVVSTYFLAAYAKIRHGGWDWPNGATFAWAIERRGTSLVDPLVHLPVVLVASQWMLLIAEFTSPLVFVLRGRWRAAFIGFWLLFHLVTYLAITIHFLPTLVCWLAFAPLERVSDRIAALWSRLGRRARTLIGGQRARRRTAGEAVPVVGDEPVDAVRGPVDAG